MVYLAEHPALAVLEVLVHLDVTEFPDDYVLLRVTLPDAMDAPAGADSKAVGDAWLKQAQAPVLRVPSVLVPQSCNLLLNPRHPGAMAARIEDVQPFVFDPRLA